MFLLNPGAWTGRYTSLNASALSNWIIETVRENLSGFKPFGLGTMRVHYAICGRNLITLYPFKKLVVHLMSEAKLKSSDIDSFMIGTQRPSILTLAKCKETMWHIYDTPDESR